MSALKIIGLITLIIVLLVVGALLFYFFYWRKRNNNESITSTSTNENQPSDNDDTDTENININDEESIKSTQKKWENFNENKKNNFMKVANDIVINSKSSTIADEELDFSELFHKPYESDELSENLFKVEEISNLSSEVSEINYDELEAIVPVDEIDLNILDDIPDFTNHGFKNIEDVITPSTQLSNNSIQLINNELF